ncbi:DUF1287 domain-containing protein [Desulfovibrio sp. OttesenSCG-928-C06]|nr:DUF1287 domain-containing protein [Desulfovibrio sp. OttesenSCG-928-C06]
MSGTANQANPGSPVSQTRQVSQASQPNQTSAVSKDCQKKAANPRRRWRARLLAAALLCVLAASAATFIPWPEPLGRTAQAFRSYFLEPSGSDKWAELPRLKSKLDANKNGLSDTDDIIEGARRYVQGRPTYRSGYHRGGYPPEGEGVCTDVIWAALANAGYDLKAAVSKDIRANRSLYRRVSTPDSNIDFRRVPNLIVYFKRHGKSLGKTIKPGDAESLAQWQPGDIVTFQNPDHVAVLSDKRNSDGLPYLLHNQGPWASEGDDFEYWQKKGITGHFRFPAE